MSRKFKINKLYIFLILFAVWCAEGLAQVRSGSAFLKMLPGARLQSMAGAHTAVLDDPHAIFANPGAAGFMRDWQWAASYTKWIADIYNTSFIYGGKIPMPWNRQSRFALGLLYQGMPEFNNKPAARAPASASDFVASLSIGQPMSFLSNNISLGANLKYFKSTLAQYTASSFVYDVGVTARTRSFSLGKKLSGVLSAGAALNQNGKDMVFDQIGTPLPKTARAGLGFYLGSHKGLNMLLSADYVSVQDEKGYLACGAEVMVNRIFALNAGYDMGSDLFKKMTFGATIRLDHLGLAVGDAFPGRHNAFRLDIATLDEADFFSRTYRGTATHFPTRPEFFEFTAPAHGDSIMTPEVVLRWQEARDLDVYDQVTYHVLVDRDSNNIAHILNAYESNPELFLALLESKIEFNKKTGRTFIPVDNLKGGDYYWAVAALDKDNQARFAHGPVGPVAHFNIPLPDIEIEDMQFEHNPYITMDDYHGRIRVKLTNNGELPARDIQVRLVDHLEKLDNSLDALASTSNDILPSSPPNVLEKTIAELAAGDVKELEFEWHSTLLGKHRLEVVVDPDERVADIDRRNNNVEKELYTVPKGALAAQDSVAALQTSTLLVDIPLITEITFDPNSSEVKSQFTQKNNLDPILGVIAKRLADNPNMSIQLEGFVDPNSEERRLELANERSEAVKKTLVDLGALETQINIRAGEILPHKYMHSDEQDAQWLLEERRFVKITTARENSAILLRPMRHKDLHVQESNVHFNSNVTSPVPLYKGALFLESDSGKAEQEIIFSENPESIPDVKWQPDFEIPEHWLNKQVLYSVAVTDSLGREFTSPLQQMMLTGSAKVKRQILSIPLQFGKTDPMAEYYWEEIFAYAKETMADSSMQLRFEGHACAIGPEAVNQRLSTERAQRFDREFRQFLKTKKEPFSESMLSRIEDAVGLGESHPLTFELKDGPVLLGDNSSSIGRKLNRRIELVFYKNGVKH